MNEPKKSPEPAAAGNMCSINNTSPRTVTFIELDPLPPPAREPLTPTKKSAETTQTNHLRLVTPAKEKAETEREPLPEIPFRSPGQISTPTSPTRAANNRTSGPSRQTSSETPLPCHNCPRQGSLLAVKTCLVCGASMCSEHLRPHLESPVFQSHTLLLPMEDISPWRCSEHQGMNWIYCRQCSGNLKEDMKKMQETEHSLMSRVAELTEKKLGYQVLLGKARAGVQQQYGTMREALEQEEAMVLLCVTQDESRTVGGLESQLSQIKENLSSLQQGLHALEGLADAMGAARVQEQAFIMEYSKITKYVLEICSVEELEAPEEVDRAWLRCLQE
ncbi:unnamed protein product [Coregonus sp. 'balchen']|nr:unnamed protein product [Coregonus sp. 'balchen']